MNCLKISNIAIFMLIFQNMLMVKMCVHSIGKIGKIMRMDVINNVCRHFYTFVCIHIFFGFNP